MDFGNYTLGRLISGRSNYDYNNPEYKRVRAHIERRMQALGYTKQRFGIIDREIGNRSFGGDDEQKVDRYGKKYSWVAYFEMWGEREAQRQLPDRRLHERTSDCSVDPSFPKRPPAWEAPVPVLLGTRKQSTRDWVGSGYIPDWSHLLEPNEINALPGPWVLLDGFVRTQNPKLDRELFGFLRGCFVSRPDIDRLRNKFLAIDYPGNRELPEGATEYTLYAGEAGRSAHYARHLLLRNGAYKRQMDEAFESYVQVKQAKKRGRRRTMEIHLVSGTGGRVGKPVLRFIPSLHETKRIPGIRVELPTVTFGWESNHSLLNQFSKFKLPAPSLIQRLGLASRNREVDFYDNSGKAAVLYRASGGDWNGDQFNGLYIRADLLSQYLKRTRQKMVWCNWGERDWLVKMDGYALRANAHRDRIIQSHGNIHRSFVEWTD